MTDLAQKKCQSCEGGIPPLTKPEAQELLAQVNDAWQMNDSATEIVRTFEFKGFYKTMAFVNAVAWIANKELHHPDLQVSYNRCVITFTTHAIEGLSENDFICARKVDQLML